MEGRIARLAEKTAAGKMWFQVTPTEYDREDLLMPHVAMSAKRVREYMLNQTPVLHDDCAFTGFLRFDGTVEGDIFTRVGHERCGEIVRAFHMKPLHNLSAFESQHSTADYQKVLRVGIQGLLAEIQQAKEKHTAPEKLEFLDALEVFAHGVIHWAEKCADCAAAMAETAQEPEVRQRMCRMAETLRRVPREPASSFYEAVQVVYLTFSFVPDSLGTLDRTLYPYYKRDKEAGRLTDAQAVAYLQELFLLAQSRTPIESPYFYRGAESHFCVGGYLPNGEDGFTELSKLIVDSLMELPTWIPELSLRWTEKTPDWVLQYMMDCERKDANKRIAFTNDEPRIRALTQIAGLSYEDAVGYSMVGCNEIALQGAIVMGGTHENVVRSMANTFHQRGEDICRAKTFEEFYAVYQEEFYRDMDLALHYNNLFNKARARDENVVSSLFMEGCIESATSVDRGGARRSICQLIFNGVPNVIDSLIITKQFVYDQKLVPMETLVDALKRNWEGYEDLRLTILKQGEFFGNDTSLGNQMAQRFCTTVYEYLKGRKNLFGFRYLVGNLLGYHKYHKWFGEKTKATPDGRFDGDLIQFGIGQSDGKDREGTAALLNAVAQYDPTGIMCGPSVTNVSLDSRLVKDEASFEKLVAMLKTYFQNGGIHFQLNYITPEELLAAKADPEAQRSLRVRVTGFSDYFRYLNEDLQDAIIARTIHES